jgi:hypothetical protein
MKMFEGYTTEEWVKICRGIVNIPKGTSFKPWEDFSDSFKLVSYVKEQNVSLRSSFLSRITKSLKEENKWLVCGVHGLLFFLKPMTIFISFIQWLAFDASKDLRKYL